MKNILLWASVSLSVTFSGCSLMSVLPDNKTPCSLPELHLPALNEDGTVTLYEEDQISLLIYLDAVERCVN
jgi:hypothetical protein